MYHLRRLAVCLLFNVGIKQFPVMLLQFLQLFLCHLKVVKPCHTFKTHQEMTSFKEISCLFLMDVKNLGVTETFALPMPRSYLQIKFTKANPRLTLLKKQLSSLLTT